MAPMSRFVLLTLTMVVLLANGRVWAADDTAVDWWGLHGQATFVTQYHLGFPSAFQGPNSLDPQAQARETFDLTLYGGLRLWRGAELWVNPEVDQGFGLSNTLGVAGFTSGEAYKVGADAPYVRLHRLFVRQTINLGGDVTHVEAGLNQLAGSQTAHRVVVTVGKFAVVDVFDTNRYAHDPRNDFLNWSIIDVGAFDYAADAWGYTYGAAVEWSQQWWALHIGLFDLSKVPNSKALDTHFFDQYQADVEGEARYTLFGQPGKLKVLGFLSHGRMGRYSEATALARQTGMPADIAAVRLMHLRGGVSLNLEQPLTEELGLFARAGWSQGHFEAFDFTDINTTVSLGLSVTGARWGRAGDTGGVAFAVNGASGAAKQFFGAGGLGILVGDGQLPHAGPEYILETYYSLAVFPCAKLSLDYQCVDHPAYNRDRGPVSILGLRIHGEL
jgi:high affinity Mn2+ porin